MVGDNSCHRFCYRSNSGIFFGMVKVIAEIGKNFIDIEQEKLPEQLLTKANALTLAAKQAGATVAKFQTHVFEDEQHKRSKARYEWIKRNERGTPYKEFWLPLRNLCETLDIQFMTTPMSKMAAEKINDLVDEWKIGSGEITDYPMLRYIADTGKPIIVSSGMSDLVQVRKALDILVSGDAPITLMHCVSEYPTPIENVNLNTIKFFKDQFPNFKIGFSDHSLSVSIPSYAVMAGAVCIEKHFSFDRGAFGPDHKVSLLPDEFKKMVEMIRRAEVLLGKYDKLLTDKEKEHWKNFRVIENLIIKKD
jgi:N,N'-diacetyllegionaminate synthase